jgi:peptide/nickel transport system permease protein
LSRYVVRRLLQSIPLLVAITLLSFALMKAAPGGPMSIYLENPDITPDDVAAIRVQLGLDDPMPVQYLKWVGSLLRLDWGYSFVTHEPVIDRIAQRLPNTLELMLVSFILTLVIAVPVGVLAAVRQYSWFDYAATGAAFFGISMPVFWFGLLMILTFAVTLGWLPTSGIATIGAEFDLIDRLRHLVMPAAVLALVSAAGYTRYIRGAMLEVIHQDYIRTARAKGLRERLIIARHAFKNAALPFVTLIALDLPDLFTGAVVTETIFAWPGMGRLYLESLSRLDYSVLMAILTVSALLLILSNLLADLLYAYLDPRIRYR